MWVLGAELLALSTEMDGFGLGLVDRHNGLCRIFS